MTQLKPCPLCGSPAMLRYRMEFGALAPYIVCTGQENSCYLQTRPGAYTDAEQCIAAWNRRTTKIDIRMSGNANTVIQNADTVTVKMK